jgi:hypothetical protein
LLRSGASGDPFGLSQAVSRLQAALGSHRGGTRRAADAFASMLDKAKGDTADILQNVYWQKALFARVGLPRDMVTQVTERSANFIHAFERNKAGVTIPPS